MPLVHPLVIGCPFPLGCPHLPCAVRAGWAARAAALHVSAVRWPRLPVLLSRVHALALPLQRVLATSCRVGTGMWCYCPLCPPHVRAVHPCIAAAADVRFVLRRWLAACLLPALVLAQIPSLFPRARPARLTCSSIPCSSLPHVRAVHPCTVATAVVRFVLCRRLSACLLPASVLVRVPTLFPRARPAHLTCPSIPCSCLPHPPVTCLCPLSASSLPRCARFCAHPLHALGFDSAVQPRDQQRQPQPCCPASPCPAQPQILMCALLARFGPQNPAILSL